MFKTMVSVRAVLCIALVVVGVVSAALFSILVAGAVMGGLYLLFTAMVRSGERPDILGS